MPGAKGGRCHKFVRFVSQAVWSHTEGKDLNIFSDYFLVRRKKEPQSRIHIGWYYIAAREERSVAQVYEALLKAGSESYKKKGSGSVQRFLAEEQPKLKDA